MWEGKGAMRCPAAVRERVRGGGGEEEAEWARERMSGKGCERERSE